MGRSLVSAARPLAAARSLTTTPSYAATVLADSPVGYWRLEEPAGSALAADLSGNNNPLVLAAGISYEQLGMNRLPQLGRGMSVTSPAGELGHVSDLALFSFSTAFSLECWFKRPDTTASTYGLITKGNLSGGTTNLSYALYINGSDGIDLRTSVNGSSINGTSTANGAVKNTNVHHLVATYNATGTVAALYLDGVRVANNTGAPASIFDSTATLRIGAGDTNGDVATVQFVSGLMDEVAVYNTVLSAARVLAHYNAGAANLRWLTASARSLAV